MNKKLLIFLIGVIVLVSIDLAVKAWVEDNWVRDFDSSQPILENEMITSFYHEPDNKKYIVKEIEVIENFWSFLYVRNYNIGFSILSSLEKHFSPEALSLFFKLLQLIGVIIILIIFFVQKMEHLPSFLFIIAGGLGNVIDRFYRGYVVDYVKWYIPDSPIEIFNPWPIFNLADVFITCGFISLIILILFSKNKQEGHHDELENQSTTESTDH